MKTHKPKSIAVIEEAVFKLTLPNSESTVTFDGNLYQVPASARHLIREARADLGSSACDNTKIIGFSDGSYFCSHELLGDKPKAVGAWCLGRPWMNLNVGIHGHALRLYPTVPLPAPQVTDWHVSGGFLVSLPPSGLPVEITLMLLDLGTDPLYLLAQLGGFDRNGKPWLAAAQLRQLNRKWHGVII